MGFNGSAVRMTGKGRIGFGGAGAALACTVISLAACGVLQSAEQHDWAVIRELDLKMTTKEHMDQVQRGMSLSEAEEALMKEGVQLTEPDQLPKRGLYGMRNLFVAMFDEPNWQVYAWRNKNNEIMLAAFQNDRTKFLWDGEYMTVMEYEEEQDGTAGL